MKIHCPKQNKTIEAHVITNEYGVVQWADIMTEKEAEETVQYINKSLEDNKDVEGEFCEALSCRFEIDITFWERFEDYLKTNCPKYWYQVEEIYLKFLKEMNEGEFKNA
jgi:hypothetical protein